MCMSQRQYRRAVGRWCTRGGVAGWYREGWYTGCIPSRYWPHGYIGIARAQPMLQLGSTVSPGHSRGLPGPLPHTLAPAPVLASIGRDSGLNILKLVIIPECRLKSMMRPAILPISKNWSKCHDLEFLGNGYRLAFSHKE